MNQYRGVSKTQMSMMNSGQNNFSQAYQPNLSLIPPQNYENSNQLVHNNLESNLFNESYIDYTIHVDSGDRTTSVFPSPYSFVLNFGGAGPGRNKYYNAAGVLQIVDYNGAPDPIIDRKFRNVKTVILDKIFFPKYIGYERIETNPIGPIYDYSGNVTLASRYRYVIVRIQELDNNRMYSTNNYVRDDSFVMYNDKTLGDANIGVWIASPYKRTYLKSALKNIDKFTINIVDPKGNPIVPTWDDAGTNKPIPQSELENEATRDKYNFQIHFIFSVLENELNTKPNFR
jgi:hypothetical protein